MTNSQRRNAQKAQRREEREREIEVMQEAAADHELVYEPPVRERTGAMKRRRRPLRGA